MAEIKLKIASVVIGSGEGGGSGVAPYYADLPDKPTINGETLSGTMTSEDLGLASASQIVPTGGTTGQVLAKKSNADNDVQWVNQESGGTDDYADLTNKPQINSVALSGNKSASDLGLATAAQGALAETAVQPSAIANMATKPQSPTNGNFVGMDGNGNLTDSGHKHSDYLTSHQDLSNYVQKSQTTGLLKNDGTVDSQTTDKAASALQPVQNATPNNFASFDSNGGIQDSGKKVTDFAQKLSFKALFIGNSISQDHITYLPFLLKRTYGDMIDFEISIFYIGGYTISDYVDNCLDGTVKANIFSTAHNTEIWTNENNTVTLQQAIKRADWDIISCQGYWNTNVTDDMSDYSTLVDYLLTNANKPFELAWLIHQSYANDSVKTELLYGAREAIQNYPTSVLFAPYFAIEYAKDDFSTSDLTPDNTHDKEGLPCMIGAYHVLGVLLKKFGVEMKILANPNKMTSAIWSTLNIPGANGTVDETFGTTSNYEKGQKDAIKGVSAAEGFFNDCKVKMAISKIPNTAMQIIVRTIVNNSNYGSASGGGYYSIGDSVQISATPQSGYEFVCWNDGNTNSTRTIVVGNANITYTAIFQPTGMTSLLGLSGNSTLASSIQINENTANSIEAEVVGAMPNGGNALQIVYPSGWSQSQEGDRYHVSATLEISGGTIGDLGIGTYITIYPSVTPDWFYIIPNPHQGVNYIDIELGLRSDYSPISSPTYILYAGWPNSCPNGPTQGLIFRFTRLNIKKIS